MRKPAARRKAPARKATRAARKVAAPPADPQAVAPKVKIAKAKGRPMLSWVGKRPLRELVAFPAQEVERFAAASGLTADIDWSEWPVRYARGGLLFHGDNKEVLAHLLANGFRSKVELIYIDPPFDSGADYVRRVELRGVRGSAKPIDAEGYTIGEQLQYTDIWANDNYLQFMYERLVLMRELLAESGVIVLHCDWRKVHHLRMLLDEVFGADKFRNEIQWYFYNKMHDVRKAILPRATHTLLVYASSDHATFNRVSVPRDKVTRQLKRIKVDGVLVNLKDESGQLVYQESETRTLDNVWPIPLIPPADTTQDTGFPTQKPQALLELLVMTYSRPGAVLLDSFIGSGTAAVVAQRLGRRWIACDINRGAIQTSSKRLIELINNQAKVRAQQTSHEADGAEALPAQLAFTTYRVNDYDLAIQQAEAVALAAETLGVIRTSTDTFFEGTIGRKLVKIIPFDHPASPIDLEEIAIEIRSRPREDRDIVAVCLGKELACDPWLAEHNRRGAPNKIQLIELRSDPKYGGLFAHTPASADVKVTRKGRTVTIEIELGFRP